MTATIRVSEIRKPGKNGAISKDGKPREGSKIRQAHDALRRGEVVPLKRMGVTVGQLSDMYGMDIQGVYKGNGQAIGSRLVGEWDGPYYVPIERIVQEA